MIKITNDTNTLNGALSELGETLASNITSKGVTASASDGLTTLANKVLQISGDTPTPSTVLFEDDLSSDKSSTWYGGERIVCGNNSPPQNLESSLDYNNNGYYVFNTVNTSDNFSGWEIPNTYGTDNIKIRAKVKINNNNAYCQFGIGFMTTTYTNQKTFAFFRIRGDNNLGLLDGNVDTTKTTSVTQYNQIRILEIIRESGNVTINEYDDSENLLYTTDYTLTMDYSPSQCYYFIARNMRYDSHSSNIYYVKAETLGSGCDCSQYTQQIENAISFINGDGT